MDKPPAVVIPGAQYRFPQERVDLEMVVRICERWGYGNVLDVVAAVWAQVDPQGALTLGPCRPRRPAEEERPNGHV